MPVRSVVSPLLDTNCHVLVDAARDAVVVDPGLGVADQVSRLVEDEGLHVRAVVVTHGHVDHTWDAAAVCAAFDVALWVHEADAHRVADPYGTLGPLGDDLARLAAAAGRRYEEPTQVRTFAATGDGDVRIDLGDGGPVLEGLHVPGHTEGSTVLLWDDRDTALTGDVLFAGTIGRTDLPGGDTAAMQRSLERLAALPPATAVLPGHGPATTIGAELLGNPFLQER